MHSKSRIAILFIALLAIMTPAMAHIGVEYHSDLGFFSGFMHPIGGMDHMVVMLCVGLWSALAAPRANLSLLWGPAGFASMLLVGALMGLNGFAIPAVEPMIAVSLLVIGLLVVTRLQVPGFFAAILVGIFAVFHGLAHGYELAGSASAVNTLAGMLTATVLLHVVGLGLGWRLRQHSVWISRAVGTTVAVLGSVMLLQMA